MKRKNIVSDSLRSDMIRFNGVGRGRIIIASDKGVVATLTIKQDNLFAHACLTGKMMNLPTTVNVNASTVQELLNWMVSFIEMMGISLCEELEYIY